MTGLILRFYVSCNAEQTQGCGARHDSSQGACLLYSGLYWVVKLTFAIPVTQGLLDLWCLQPDWLLPNDDSRLERDTVVRTFGGVCLVVWLCSFGLQFNRDAQGTDSL